MSEGNHIFLKNGSDLFLVRTLERVDRIGRVDEIGFFAHRRAALPGGPSGSDFSIVAYVQAPATLRESRRARV
jgi:hypothetical protein